MAVKVLELHHHGIRVGPAEAEVKKALRLLPATCSASTPDPGRPTIPTIDGYWMDVGGTAQIHLMGVDGQSKFAEGPGQGPLAPARGPRGRGHPGGEDRSWSAWACRSGSRAAWSGPQSQQIFMHDPFGNMIELHQAGHLPLHRRPSARPSRRRAAMS